MNRVLLIKLQPNQDLYEGLEAACTARGMRKGLILSGVGSLNEAVFEPVSGNPSGTAQRVAGPGLEIAGLSGELRIETEGGGASRLVGWITHTDGTVVGGAFVRGLNIVSITFEITILEWTGAPPTIETHTDKGDGRLA